MMKNLLMNTGAALCLVCLLNNAQATETTSTQVDGAVTQPTEAVSDVATEVIAPPSANTPNNITTNTNNTSNTTNTSNNSQTEVERSPIRIEMHPEIMGLWGMAIPNNSSCVEFYNFRNANEVAINSGKEWSYAEYDYQPSLDPEQKLSALVMQIRFDNNQVDCSGHQQDQTDETARYFVKWINPNHIQFCATEKGQQCVANLRRVLP